MDFFTTCNDKTQLGVSKKRLSLETSNYVLSLEVVKQPEFLCVLTALPQ